LRCAITAELIGLWKRLKRLKSSAGDLFSECEQVQLQVCRKAHATRKDEPHFAFLKTYCRTRIETTALPASFQRKYMRSLLKDKAKRQAKQKNSSAKQHGYQQGGTFYKGAAIPERAAMAAGF
jgi:hypothetical protein